MAIPELSIGCKVCEEKVTSLEVLLHSPFFHIVLNSRLLAILDCLAIPVVCAFNQKGPMFSPLWKKEFIF